jgi:hypothetical protein
LSSSIEPHAGVWREAIVPLVGILILIPAVYTSFYPNPGSPLDIGPWVIVGWLVIGAVHPIWRESKHREITIDCASADIGESGPPRRRMNPNLPRQASTQGCHNDHGVGGKSD